MDGVVAKGSSSASGSSSSGVGVIRETKPKRTFARELSARRAGTSELVPRQPVSMETGTSEDALVLPQGEPRVLGPGPNTEVPMHLDPPTMSFYRQGDHHSHTQHLEQHDQRSVQVHQQILNQVAHTSADQEVVLEAARQVVAANQRVSATEAQALQAVVQARGEAEAMVNETRSQAQVLSVRFAAELELAQQREQKLKEHIEGLRRELERRETANHPPTNPNIPKLREETPGAQPPNGAGNSFEIEAITALSIRIKNLEEEFHSLREIVQDLWINQESWNQWPETESPQHGSNTPQAPTNSNPNPPPAAASVPTQAFRMDSGSEDEGKGASAPGRPGTPAPAEEDVESSHVKQKDLHYMKFPALPESAGAFRAWRNSIVPMLAAFDRSPDGSVSEWILKALRARSEPAILELHNSSDPYPRLDRVLAGALTKPEHLKSHFGLKFQSYIEDCESCSRPLRGRVLLNFVAREFGADSTYGTVVSELELFSLPAPEGSMQSLKAWRDKVRYILSQLPTADRPSEKLLSKWIFERLKKVGLMRRHTDRVRDSPEGAPERSFDWLWSRLERTILEGQQDQNLLSIQEALRKGPKKETPGVPAPTDKNGKPKGGKPGTGKGKDKDKDKGKGNGTPNKDKDKDKNKDKSGKDKGKGKKDDPLFQKAKEEGVCIFYQKDKCTRGDSCPFKHEKITVPGAPAPQAKAKAAAAKATPKAAAVALVVAALTSGATANSVGSSCTLDVIGDTGAGEHLGSKEAFLSQGVSSSVVDQFCGTSSSHIAFETGGGKKHSNQSIGVWSESLKNVANMFMLKSCPLVYSIGQFVMNQGYSFFWPSGELPYLIPPHVDYKMEVDADECRVADRVEHCVPIYKERVELISGMPAGPLVPLVPPDFIKKASESPGWESFGGSRLCTTPNPESFQVGEDHSKALRNTWLHTAKDQWFEVENQVKWQELECMDASLPFAADLMVTEFHNGPPPPSGESAKIAVPREPAQRAVPEGKVEEQSNSAANQDQNSDEEWVEDLEPNHFLTHYPKSRKCNVCLQAKLTGFYHRRRPNQSESLQDARNAEEPDGPCQRIAVDHMFVYDQPADGDEVVSFVCRDRFSGLVWAYPAESKDSEEVENSLRHFCGRKSPIVSVASDCAPEILKAVRELGFNSEPSVPGDPLHNPFAESTIRTLKQGTRTLLLQSGLGERFWKYAQRCFAFHCNVTLEPPKVIQDLAKEREAECGSTRFEAHLGYSYEGYLIPFCALVWYKNKDAATFAPRGEASLYMGPSIIDGLRHKGVHLVAPVERIREGDFSIVATKELAVPNGKWSFPLARAKRLDEDNPHHRLPPSESFVAPPGEFEQPHAIADGDLETQTVKRHRSITKLRIATHGKTPKCEGCKSGSYNHSPACRKRFDELLDLHEPLTKLTAAETAEDEEFEQDYRPPPEPEPPAFTGPGSGGSGTVESSSGLTACVDLLLSPCGGVVDEGLAQRLFSSLPQESAFALPAATRRELEKESVGACVVEFCCSPDSNLRRVTKEFGVEYLGLSRDFVDLTDPQQVAQIELWMTEQATQHKVLHLIGSLPTLDRHKRNTRNSETLLVRHFTKLAEVASCSGGTVTFEWPRDYVGWRDPLVLQLVASFDLHLSYPTGCGFRLHVGDKRPLMAWCVASSSHRLTTEFSRRECNCEHRHPELDEHEEFRARFYNRAMATVILGALCPTVVHDHVPAMPVVSRTPETSEHVQREIPGMPGFQESFVLVTKSLSRKELLASKEALEAIRKEGEKLRRKDTWDDSSAIEPDQLCEQAKKSGTKLHIADAMTIAGIKNYEMPADKQVYKGRVVYRGDAVRDERGSPALFQALHSLPTNIQAINLTLFLGMLSTFVVQAADACQAFLQAPLKTSVPTWVVLPPELWLPQWKGKFRRVAVKLRKALYGHPDAPAFWQVHLEGILTPKLQATVVEGFPSVFWIPSLRVLVTIYVDDILAAGRPETLKEFWAQLSKHIEIEAPSDVDRFLGRYHHFQDAETVFLHMGDDAKQAIDLYASLPGAKPLKAADSPYVSEGSLTLEDWEVRGELAQSSAKILMKLLWYARLCRPDLAHAISTLAAQSTSWTKNSDKQTHRLMC